MFDDVHFTGTINLGNLVNALVFLIGAITLYYRVKAKIKEYELRDRNRDQGDQGDQKLLPPPDKEDKIEPGR